IVAIGSLCPGSGVAIVVEHARHAPASQRLQVGNRSDHGHGSPSADCCNALIDDRPRRTVNRRGRPRFPSRANRSIERRDTGWRNRMSIHKFAAAMLAGLAMLGLTAAAAAQEITLRLHQFLPPQSTVPAEILTPWAKRIEAQSGGRIRIEIYSSMALGGKPSDLYDPAREGVVDMVYTLVGYTPGRFPRVAVFAMPFML